MKPTDRLMVLVLAIGFILVILGGISGSLIKQRGKSDHESKLEWASWQCFDFCTDARCWNCTDEEYLVIEDECAMQCFKTPWDEDWEGTAYGSF